MNPSRDENRDEHSAQPFSSNEDDALLPAKEFEVGDHCTGTVIAFIEGGALLRIGHNVVGVLPNKHADFRNHWLEAQAVFAIGDEVPVILSDLKRKDDGRCFIRFKRDPVDDPWQQIEEIHPDGSRDTGTVARFLRGKGVLVELSSGFIGFLPLSEISWVERKIDPKNHFSEGEQIDLVVMESDKENRRIQLSLRLAVENPWDSFLERYPIGSKHLGEIMNVQEYGAFVRLDNGMEGLMHRSKYLSDDCYFENGQKIQVEILSFDSERKRIGLGMVESQ